MEVQVPPAPPQPPPPAKQSFLRRHKYVLPLLLAANVSAGAYILLKGPPVNPHDRETDSEKTTATTTPAAPCSTTTSPPIETNLPLSPKEPMKVHDPIPEDQQRELFKWILEEKRKVKTKVHAEKKRIDEEKAILKQFIRSKSIPTI